MNTAETNAASQNQGPTPRIQRGSGETPAIHWPTQWHRTNRELSSLDRFKLLGWDEV